MKFQKINYYVLIITLINTNVYQCATTLIPISNPEKMVLRGNYKNVASIKEGAVILKEAIVNFSAGNILNEEHSGNSNYANFNGYMTIRLAQKFSINTIFFKLYDGDSREYKLEVFVSENQVKWDRVYNNYHAQSWQEAKFTERRVQFIKFLSLQGDVDIVYVQARYSWS